MVSQLSTLLFQSLLMAISSFLAGLLPLTLSLSARRLDLATHLGSGLLLGTALAIIIPEGIGLLSTATKEPNGIIGFTLVLGFAGMYLLDALTSVGSEKSVPENVPLNNLEDDLESDPELRLKPTHPTATHNHSNATTIGLSIHAVTDGIALGASSVSSGSVSLLVFVAIMIHKAPASFGLTTTLLGQGVGRRTVRAHLLIFSLAAPAGALATWLLIQLLAGGALGAEDAVWTGGAMVFSGGTFL
jgi:zinc transporter 9